MIIEKIKYGAWITVASSMILGSSYWFLNDNPMPKGQSQAEAYAAVTERNVA